MNIDIIDILFLPAVIFIGIVTSIEDIKTNKIRNKWILFGFVYGILVFMGLFVWNLTAEPVSQFFYTHVAQIGPDDPRPIFMVHSDIFWKTGLNSFFSLLLGYILWKFGKLSAGDAKLFFIYALLIPTSYYWRSYLPLFPAFALFINMFVIVLLYFIIRSCVYWLKKYFRNSADNKEKTKKQKKKNYKKSIIEKLKIIAGFTTIFLLFYYIRGPILRHFSIDLGSSQQLFFVIIIIFSRRIMKVYVKNNKVFFSMMLLGVILSGYGFLTDFWMTIGIMARTLRIMVIFMIVMGILSKVVSTYVDSTSSLLIPASNLRSRMVLDKIFLNNMKRGDKSLDKSLGKIVPGGLDFKQVEAVKDWAGKKGIKEILILKKFPFAVWMFLAVVVTLIIKGSLINFVINIF